MTLFIEKENSSFLKLKTSDEGIIRHIKDEFTFDIPNYKFTKAYKSGKTWNGKINLLKRNNLLYSGLLGVLKEFLKKNRYEFVDNFSEKNPDIVSLETVKNHISFLKLNYEPRDYQIAYVHSILNQKNGIIVSPTSSGKTLTLFIFLTFILKHNKAKKLLILVPSISLIQQMIDDFISYTSSDSIKSFFKNQVHLQLDGVDKFSEKKVTISCWQSAINLPSEYLKMFDFVCADEVHSMSKTSGQSILESCINSNYRIGLTGTLQETTLDLLVLEGLFGQPLRFVTTKELMDRNEIAKLRIKNIILPYSKNLSKTISKLNFQQEYEFIISLNSRMKILIDLISSLEENTLVLFTRIEKHGEIIFNNLLERELDKKILFLSGKNNAKEREEVRQITENNKNVIIIGSYGVISQGVSIKNIHNIIFSSPYKAKIKILQSIGRGLRLHPEKKFCTIYDLVDYAKYKGRQNYFLSHFLSRFELYQTEQFFAENIKFPFEVS